MDRKARTTDEHELSWHVVGGDAWESARPRPSDVQPQVERWEPIIDNLARGRLVAVGYDGTMAGRKGLAVSLARAAARRGIRVEARHTKDVVIFWRNNSRSVDKEQGARHAAGSRGERERAEAGWAERGDLPLVEVVRP